MNSLAGQGWQLVTTSERDARWMGGETVILVQRRYVVTEAMFVARFTAEEQLRRRVMRNLSTSDH